MQHKGSSLKFITYTSVKSEIPSNQFEIHDIEIIASYPGGSVASVRNFLSFA